MLDADIGAELARRLPFIEYPVFSIHRRFLLIYGVASKTGTSN
jgi:hypothetical protein